LQVNYVTVIVDRPILSAEYRLPVVFLSKLTHAAVARSLSTVELLVIIFTNTSLQVEFQRSLTRSSGFMSLITGDCGHSFASAVKPSKIRC